MSKTISIFFNTDRTYITLVNKKRDGLELLYLNSTKCRIDLENPESDESVLGIKELGIFFEEIGKDFNRIAITLPAESVLVNKLPGKENMPANDLKQLVYFEVRQRFPQFSYEDFTISVTPFARGINKKPQMLCVIIPNEIFDTAAKIISPLQMPIDHVEISQLNAHSAFLYNYPELASQNVVIASIQNQFIDISLSKAALPGYYNLAVFSSPLQIADALEKEFQRILSTASETIDAAFFFGNGLTKDVMLTCWETSMMIGIESKRLNPFRMMKSQLGQREKEYCSRTFQLYPPCIGGSLPLYHNRLKLY